MQQSPQPVHANRSPWRYQGPGRAVSGEGAGAEREEAFCKGMVNSSANLVHGMGGRCELTRIGPVLLLFGTHGGVEQLR